MEKKESKHVQVIAWAPYASPEANTLDFVWHAGEIKEAEWLYPVV